MRYRRILDLNLVTIIAIVVSFVVSTLILIHSYRPPEHRVIAADLGLTSLLGVIAIWLMVAIYDNLRRMTQEIRKPPERRFVRKIENS